MSVTLPEVVSLAVSALFCVWYFMQKHWLANNALGLAFSIQGIEHISIGKLSTGAGSLQAHRHPTSPQCSSHCGSLLRPRGLAQVLTHLSPPPGVSRPKPCDQICVRHVPLRHSLVEGL